MEKYNRILHSVRLFEGIGQKDMSSMLNCLGAKVISVPKDNFILSEGDRVERVGIVLEGLLHIVRGDINGNRMLVAALMPGDFFAEALCCAEVAESPVSVVADTDARVMQLDFGRVLGTCPNSCSFHLKLIKNMLRVIAVKNLQLQSRMELLGKKTIRARLMSYLESVAIERGREFSIPFNREELADFLCIDRSALSRELSRLRDEGALDYRKNNFKLL